LVQLVGGGASAGDTHDWLSKPSDLVNSSHHTTTSTPSKPAPASRPSVSTKSPPKVVTTGPGGGAAVAGVSASPRASLTARPPDHVQTKRFLDQISALTTELADSKMVWRTGLHLPLRFHCSS
jgi:hypothetical protein